MPASKNAANAKAASKGPLAGWTDDPFTRVADLEADESMSSKTDWNWSLPRPSDDGTLQANRVWDRLPVSTCNDPLEQEAERIADQVSVMPRQSQINKVSPIRLSCQTTDRIVAGGST
jgi:hypothetical protein